MDRYIRLGLDTFFAQVTHLGDLIYYGIICLLALALGAYTLFLQLAASVILMMGIAIVIKALYSKDRPIPQKKGNLIELLDSRSFPSVHAMRMTALAFWLALYFAQALITLYLVLVAAIVIYSRVYLKKHYWTDVLGGILLALIIDLAVWLVIP